MPHDTAKNPFSTEKKGKSEGLDEGEAIFRVCELFLRAIYSSSVAFFLFSSSSPPWGERGRERERLWWGTILKSVLLSDDRCCLSAGQHVEPEQMRWDPKGGDLFRVTTKSLETAMEVGITVLTCKSFVRTRYRGERLIEPPSSWFSSKFPPG